MDGVSGSPPGLVRNHSLRRRASAAVGHLPRSVWILAALYMVLGVWWSVIVPVGDPPDESSHFDLVAHVAESGSYPDYDGRLLSVSAGFLSGLGSAKTPEAAPQRGTRQTFSESDRPIYWTDQNTGEKQPVLNQMPQHPPLYYTVAASALRTVRGVAGGELPIDREVKFLRLMGVVMISPVPFAAYVAAERLGASASASKASAVMTLAVPQVLHVGAAVSYMPLAIGAGAVLAVFVAGVIGGDARRSTAGFIGAVGAICLWTISSSVFLLAGVGLAYLHLARTGSADRRLVARRAILALGTGAVLGSPWWIRNLIRHGTPIPSTDSDYYGSLRPSDGFAADPGHLLTFAWDVLPQRFFGAFGTVFDAQLRGPVVVLLVILSGLGIVAALVPRRLGADDGLTGSRVAVFLAPLVFVLAFVLYRSWDLYEMSGFITFLQGRYLFIAIVPFAVAVGAGLTRLVGRWAPVALLVVAGLAQLEGSRAVLDTWWAEPSASLARELRAVSRWNAGFDALPVVLLLTMAMLGVWGMISLLRFRDPGTDQPLG